MFRCMLDDGGMHACEPLAGAVCMCELPQQAGSQHARYSSNVSSPCRYSSTLVLAGSVVFTPLGTPMTTGTPPMVLLETLCRYCATAASCRGVLSC